MWEVSQDRLLSGVITPQSQLILRNAGFHSAFKNPSSESHIGHVVCNFSQVTPHTFTKSCDNLSTFFVYFSNKLLRLQIYVVDKDNVINIRVFSLFFPNSQICLYYLLNSPTFYCLFIHLFIHLFNTCFYLLWFSHLAKS